MMNSAAVISLFVAGVTIKKNERMAMNRGGKYRQHRDGREHIPRKGTDHTFHITFHQPYLE